MASREFTTGANRDGVEGKLRYLGFNSALTEKRFAEYMHLHRKQANGELREPDNWKLGIPKDAYADSLIRHIQDFKLHVEGFPEEAEDKDIESVCCAIMFNIRGYLYETLKEKKKIESFREEMKFKEAEARIERELFRAQNGK